MKEGNRKKSKVKVLRNNFFKTYVQANNKKSSFIISGRRTYIDILAQPFIRKVNEGNPAGYYFYDLNTKINYKFSEKDRIYLSAYLGKTDFICLKVKMKIFRSKFKL